MFLCVFLSRRFILFQALSWTFYALCLVLAMSCLLFWGYLAKFTFGLVTSFGVLGVLSQVRAPLDYSLAGSSTTQRRCG